MNPLTISLKQARNLALYKQGLYNKSIKEGKTGTLEVINDLGYVQIDTLSVVARAHHHTLWNRVKNYSEEHLNELLEKDKQIFEYWSHAAAYLPMADFRFSLPRKHIYATSKSHWFKQDKKVQSYVFDRIKAEGPLRSKDFEYKKTSHNWFEWKPAKRALEQLFMEGQLMIAGRQGFQKIYDLTERVLPTCVNTTFPTIEEQTEHLILKAIKAHGLITEKEIIYLRSGIKTKVGNVLKQLLNNNIIKLVKIKELDDVDNYMLTSDLSLLEKRISVQTLQILSPFDNAVIQRKRLQRLFNFDYSIECYLPENKRTYGYFCLPVIYKGQFVARFDPKADRTGKIFHIKSFYPENNFSRDKKFTESFQKTLLDFAKFNKCDNIDESFLTKIKS